jgi:hypothetical protein
VRQLSVEGAGWSAVRGGYRANINRIVFVSRFFTLSVSYSSGSRSLLYFHAPLRGLRGVVRDRGCVPRPVGVALPVVFLVGVRAKLPYGFKVTSGVGGVYSVLVSRLYSRFF